MFLCIDKLIVYSFSYSLRRNTASCRSLLLELFGLSLRNFLMA